MKRTISALIFAALILTAVLAAFPAYAAPAGTAIKSAADFMNMSIDGEYYLDNDITLTASYADSFKGTLDGNGHTLTVTEPAFTKIAGGSVKNLSISVKYLTQKSSMIGALAYCASGNFENVNIDIDITVADTAPDFAYDIGGLISLVDGNTVLKNCSAYGKISMLTEKGVGGMNVGGIVGRIKNAGTVEITGCTSRVALVNCTFSANDGGIAGGVYGKTNLTVENCVNYGELVTKSGDHSGTGGIIGVVSGASAPDATVAINNCANFGKISDREGSKGAQSHHLGGIVGRAYGIAKMDITSCTNAGDIDSVGGGWASAGGIVGGLMTYGFSWVGFHDGINTVTKCVNFGSITGAQFGGGIIGGALQHNTDGSNLTLKDSANYGDVVANTYAGGIIGQCGESAFNGLLVSGCYNEGRIECKAQRAAGIVGRISTMSDNGDNKIGTYLPISIESCFNAGEVVNKNTAVGIVGRIGTGTVNITECTNTGTLSAPASAHMTVSDTAITVNATDNYTNDKTVSGDKYVKYASSTAISKRREAIKSTIAADASELCDLIRYVFGYSKSDVDEGFDGFLTAYDAAIESILKTVPQTEINAANSALKNAIAAMKFTDMRSSSLLSDAVKRARKVPLKNVDYITETKEAFLESWYNARIILAARAEQSIMDAAADDLNAAIDGLDKLMNPLKLSNAVSKYKKYISAEYTRTSWLVFEEALKKVQKLCESEYIPEKVGTAALEELENAKNALEKRVYPDELFKKVMSIKEEYTEDKYTPSSYAALAAALREADVVVTTQYLSAEDIANCEKTLDDAIAQLVKRADLTEIDAVVATVSALKAYNYDEESFENLKKVLAEIESVRAELRKTGEVTEEDIKDLPEKLTAAINGLVGTADYTEIDKLLEKVNLLEPNDYTVPSRAALDEVIARISALKLSKATTADDSKMALEALKTAVLGLEIAEPIDDPKSTEGPVSTLPESKDTDEEKTGGCNSSAAAGAVVFVAFALGLSVVCVKGSKKRI